MKRGADDLEFLFRLHCERIERIFPSRPQCGRRGVHEREQPMETSSRHDNNIVYSVLLLVHILDEIAQSRYPGARGLHTSGTRARGGSSRAAPGRARAAHGLCSRYYS